MVSVRGMMRKDIAKVMAIEESINSYHTKDDFTHWYSKRPWIATVVLDGEEVQGYIVCEARDNYYDVVAFGVKPKSQGLGYGKILLDSVKEKLKQKRKSLFFLVSEYDTKCHFFLRDEGFRAVETVKNAYCREDRRREDGYKFRYTAGLPYVHEEKKELAEVS